MPAKIFPVYWVQPVKNYSTKLNIQYICPLLLYGTIIQLNLVQRPAIGKRFFLMPSCHSKSVVL